jgi:glyoxylase-like metal-dependent hydrolase (beta-lactamase superfamily II)
MMIEPFFDERTGTVTYVVYDLATGDAVVIDPVLDYEPAASKIWTESADKVIAYLREKDLKPHFILETHAHADHLSAAQELKKVFPQAVNAVGERITLVQQTFKTVFGLPVDFPTDGSQFDRLLHDGETVTAGTLSFKVISTPGHTPACASYLIEDAVFTGDTLFMPDMGTGRCDFPLGSAEDLFSSISNKLYTLPASSRVFVGHDYQPGGREVAWESTIEAQKKHNIQLKSDTTQDDFVKFRQERDKTLAAPRLLFQSVQVNIDAGALPAADDSCRRYLKIPVNIFRPPADGELTLDECN